MSAKFCSILSRQKWVLLSACTVVLVFCLGVQHSTHQGYDRSLEKHRQASAALLHAVETTVVRSIQSVNGLMFTLADAIPQLQSSADTQLVLQEQLLLSPQLRAIDLVDARGSVISSSLSKPLDSVELSCIPMLSDNPFEKLKIGLAKQGRHLHDTNSASSSFEYIPLCFPIRDKSNQLTHVLVASLNPSYFHDVFASTFASLDAHAHLLHYDDRILTSTYAHDFNYAELKRHLTEQSWGQYYTQIEGETFLVSFRSTSLLPIVLVSASAVSSALVEWREDKVSMQLMLLGVVIVIGGIVIVVISLREKRLEASQNLLLLSKAMETTASAIFITDTQGVIQWINRAFTTLTGFTSAEARGKTARIFNSGKQPTSFFAELWRTILAGQVWRGEIINLHKNGHVYTVQQTITPIINKRGQIESFVAVQEDVTARKSAEQKAKFLQDHDALTGLPNRRYFEQQLTLTLMDAQADTQFAVVIIDIDRFKDVNDSMGHEAGDALLVRTAFQLQDLIGKKHLLARLGGDEYALLIKHVKAEEELADFAYELLDVVGQPFTYLESTFNVTCSIGISLGLVPEADSSMLLRQADMAMYRAKHQGKNTFRFFDKEMDTLMQRRVSLQQHLDTALQTGTGFSLRYQPQVDVATGSICGVEALIRWEMAPGQWVSPAEFIPLAEETGQIIDIGRWVIDAVCQQVSEWEAKSSCVGKTSINISVVELSRTDVAGYLLETMKMYGIKSNQISVEITETALMGRIAKVLSNLEKIKQAGITIAIDDFGTGYSSLNYLQEIEADYLKIDRSFVVGIKTRPSDEHIIIGTIALAHSLGLKVIAEGVETEEQLAFLKKHQCEYFQGYLYARPLLPDELVSLLSAANS